MDIVDQHPRPYGGDEGLVINTRLLDIEREQAEQKKRDAEYKNRQLRFDKLVAYFTGGLVLVTAISNGLMLYQTRISKLSADAATLSAQQARRSANIAQDSVTQSSKALKELLDNTTQSVDKTIGQSQKALDTTVTLWRADQKHNQKALDTTVMLSRMDQRAWLSISKVELSAEPGQTRTVDVTVWFQNTGRTPALNITYSWSLYMWSSETALPPLQLDKQAITGFILTSGNSTPVITVHSAEVNWSPEHQLTDVTLADYKAKRLRFYVQLACGYRDVFQQAHMTHVCAYHMFGEQRDEFRYCNSLNTME